MGKESWHGGKFNTKELVRKRMKAVVSLLIVLTMVVTLVADPLGVVIATRQAIFGAQGADIASPPAIDIVTTPPAVDVTPAPPATQPPIAPPTSPPQQPLPPLETTTRPAISVTPPAIGVAPSPDIQARINYLTAAREALLAQLAELDLQIAELQYRIAQSSNLSVEDAIYILQQNIDAYNYTIAYLFNRQFAATSSDEMLEMMEAIAYYNARIQNATSNIAGLYDGTLQPSDIYTLSVEYLQYQLAELFVLRHALLVQLAEIEHELFLLLSCPLSANLIADISNYTLQAQELIAQVFELVMAHVGILEAIRYADSQAQYDAYLLQLQELYEYFRQIYDLTQVLADRVDEIEWLILANQLYQEILLTNFAALQATMYELEDLLVMFAYLHANGMPNVGMSPLTLCNPTGLATIVTDVNASVPFGMAVAFSLWPEGATRIIRLLADVEISADALTQGGPAGSELHIFSYCGCTSTGPGTQGPFSITRTYGTGRHFIVPADRTMHLYNVYVTRAPGLTTDGGGVNVINGGHLHLHADSVISNNRAAYGGGVFVGGNSQLTMHSGAVISHNHAANGGGIASAGNVYVTMHPNAEIRNNVATQSGGGIWSNGNLVLQGGVIYNNQAWGMAGGQGGGGIWYSGGSGLLCLTNVTVLRNTAGVGGGIRIVSAMDGDLNANPNLGVSIVGSTISDNDATSGGGISHPGGNLPFTIHDSTIANNWANASGGGITLGGALTHVNGLVITNSFFYGNGSSNTGGAMQIVSENTLNITNTVFGYRYYNGALVTYSYSRFIGMTVATSNTSGAGGAIYHQGGGSGYINFTNVIMANNRAPQSSAGGIAVSNGGFADYNNVMTMNITNSLIHGNSAGSFGGAIHIHRPYIYLNITNSVFGYKYENADFVNFEFVGGERVPSGNSAHMSGGAIWHVGGGLPVVITESTISHNRAGSGGSGGGISIGSNNRLNIINSFINYNSSGGGGGIAHGGGSSQIKITNTTMKGNSAGTSSGTGGGIIVGAMNGDLNANPNLGVYITNSTIRNNIAGGLGSGAGIWHGGGNLPFVIHNSTFANNVSGSGGGISVNSALTHENGLAITNSFFYGNFAREPRSGGGAILIQGAADLNLTNVIFGYRYEDGMLVLEWYNGNNQHTTTTNLCRGEGGGAIHHIGNNGSINLTNVIMANNRTSGMGGGIRVGHRGGWGTGEVNVTITNSMLHRNVSSLTGGVINIHHANTSLYVYNSVFGYMYYNAAFCLDNFEVIDGTRVVATMPNVGGFGGGGIASVGGAHPIVISNSTIANNATGTSVARGGGIQVSGTGELIITNSRMHSNFGNDAGGAIEMRAINSILTITDSVIGYRYEDGENIPAGNTTGMIGTSEGFGGAIWHAGGNQPVTLTNVILSNNEARFGGGIFINRSLTHAQGLTISNSRIENNSGGGINEWGSVMSGYGGGIYLVANDGISNFHIVDSHIVGNAAHRIHQGSGSIIGGHGGGIKVTTSVMSGGSWGSGNGNGSAVGTITNTTIGNNSAGNKGGGMFLDVGTVTVQGNSVIDGNTAELFSRFWCHTYQTWATQVIGYGGGVFVAEDATLYLQNTAVTNNHAGRDGGGIFTEDFLYALVVPTTYYSNISIPANVTFSGNTAGNGSFRPPTNHAQFVSRATRPIVGAGRSPAVTIRQTHLINNYDVNFNMLFHLVTFSAAENGELYDGDPLPQRVYDTETIGGNVTIPVPVPAAGYRFAGWVSRYLVETVLYDYYYIYYCDCEDYCYCFYYGHYYGYYCYCYDFGRRQNIYVNIYYYGYYAYYDLTIDQDIIVLRNIHFIAMFELDTIDVKIGKVLSGDMADPDTPYNFTITFYRRGDEGNFELLPASVATAFYFEITNSTTGATINTPAPNPMPLTYSVGQFTLLHNQTITLTGVPSGVYVRIVETLPSDHPYQVTIHFNSAELTNTPAENDTGRRQVMVIEGENDNLIVPQFVFTNLLDMPPETGVTVAATGIMLMIGLGIFAAGATVVFKSSRKKYM